MNQWHPIIAKGADYLSECTGQPTVADRIIAHAEQRCVVAYANPSQRYVGKFYTDDSGKKACAAMQAARLANAPLAVPRPLFFADTLRLLVMPYIDAPNYGELISQPNFAAMLAQAGRALASLHISGAPNDLPAQGGESNNYVNLISDLMNPHPLILAQQLPEQREAIVALLSAQHTLSQINPDPITRLHRDFHLRQMFYAPDQTWLIDWDLSDWGEAALDVGNFLVYLHTHLPYPLLMSSCAAFLEGYASINTVSAQRVQLYASMTYLRLACKHFRRQSSNWQTHVDQMLKASAASLPTEMAIHRNASDKPHSAFNPMQVLSALNFC